jgi:hypothetical protein
MATLMNTHVDGNHNDNSGGGVSNAGTLYLRNSLVSGNTAADNAGGIHNSTGTLLVVNSTISGNSADIHAGGILNSTTAALINTTITDNTADADADDVGHAGGVYNNSSAGAVLTIRNTIIGGNVDNSAVTIISDCSGTLISEGYNLIENLTGCALSGSPDGNITGASPDLGPLQLNGGPTLSHSLLAGSPAIDAGNPGGCLDENSAALTDDQRGFIRPADGDGNSELICDIGAFEYLSPGAPTPTNTPTATMTPTDTATATIGPSPTPTDTATPGPSPTPTDTSTPGPSPTPSNTPLPTETSTPGPSPTATMPFVPSHWLYLPVNLDD